MLLLISKLCTYIFALLSAINESVSLQCLFKVSIYPTATLDAIPDGTSTITTRIFVTLTIKDDKLNEWSHRKVTTTPKILLLVSTAVESVFIITSELLQAKAVTIKVIPLVDRILTYCASTMILTWLSQEVNIIGIGGGTSLIILSKNLPDTNFALLSVLVELRNQTARLLLVPMILLCFGVIIILLTEKKLVFHVPPLSNRITLKLRINNPGTLPLSIAAIATQLNSQLSEKVILLYVPLIERNHRTGYAKSTVIATELGLYASQVFPLLVLSFGRNYDALITVIRTQAKDAETQELSVNMLARLCLVEYYSQLTLLSISYILLVSLTSKLLYLRFGAPLFSDGLLLTFTNTLAEQLRPIGFYTNLVYFISATNNTQLARYA